MKQNNPESTQKMKYKIEFSDQEGFIEGGQQKAACVYTFTVSSGFGPTTAEVYMTYADIDIIRDAGKEPREAARLALEGLVESGRDPFESQIWLEMSHFYAEYFALHGDFGGLPTLVD
jgi:hypothetical protein